MCMNRSLPTSIKLPSRTTGSSACCPVGGAAGCPTAVDTTARRKTPTMPISVSRFTVFPSVVLLLHSHAVHQRLVPPGVQSCRLHTAGADTPHVYPCHAPPFSVDTIKEGKRSGD